MSPTDDIAGMVRAALHAYELGAAENIRAERAAVAEHERRRAELAGQEAAAKAGLAESQRAELDAATAAHDRLAAIATAAEEVKRAAADLLEKSALGYLAGLATDAKGGHTFTGTPDERAAHAFTAAQLAAVDLRQHLVELALTHLAAEDWDSAFEILNALHNEWREGVLLDTVRVHLRDAIIGRERRDMYVGDHRKRLERLRDWVNRLGDDDGELRRIGSEILVSATEAFLERGQQPEAFGLMSFAKERGFSTGRTEANYLQWWVPATTTPMACIAEFGGHSKALSDVAFRLDGATVVSADQADLKEWVLPTATRSGYLMRTHSGVVAHGLSADGRTAMGDETIWRGADYEPGELGIRDGLYGCGLSADGESFLWEKRDSTRLRLALQKVMDGNRQTWHFVIRDKLDGRLSRQFGGGTFRREAAFPSTISFDYNGLALDSRGNTSVDADVVYFSEAGVSRSDSGKATAILKIEESTVWLRSGISSNASKLATLDAFGTVVVFDCTAKQSVYRLEIDIKEVGGRLDDGGLRFSGDESVLVVFGTGDHGRSSVFHAWDMTNGASLCSARKDRAVTALAVANRARIAALGRADGAIDAVDLRSGQVLALANSGAVVRCLRFSHDDGLLASGGDDRIVRIWQP
jgi:WD40 repeat protein